MGVLKLISSHSKNQSVVHDVVVWESIGRLLKVQNLRLHPGTAEVAF